MSRTYPQATLRLFVNLVLLSAQVLQADEVAPALRAYSYEPDSARTLVKDGSWIRDGKGRYVLLRGVNLGPRSKLPPYIPIIPLTTRKLDPAQFERELQVVRPALARLRVLGMNVARLPVMWKALEPTPNPDLEQLQPEALQYLQCVKEIIDELYYREKLYVILDFHQDISNEIYGGDGFPDWAVAVDSVNKWPLPGSDLRDQTWSLNYLQLPWYDRLLCHLHGGSCGRYSPQVRATLQSFWFDQLLNQNQNETDRSTYLAHKPQTHFVRIIGLVAKFFASMNKGTGHPAIIGYEPFNEPHEVGIPKKHFEQDVLSEFYAKVKAEIGRYDNKALVFVEPRVDWTTFSASGPENQGLKFTHEPQSFLPTYYTPSAVIGDVFSFHYYDPWLMTGFPFRQNMHDKAKEWPEVFKRLHAAAISRGLVPFLTELGCSQDWTKPTDLRPNIYHHQVVRACMDLQFQQVETQLLNETYWNYDLYNTQLLKDNWNRENFSLLGPDRSERNLDIVARPYPVRSSAVPGLVFFDLESKNAVFILEGIAVDAPTVIFVPESIQYPEGEFQVRTTTSESTVTWDQENQMLYWLPDKNSSENQLAISPVHGFKSSILPVRSQSLMSATRSCLVVSKDRDSTRCSSLK